MVINFSQQYSSMPPPQREYIGFWTRLVYPIYITCLTYTILFRNPRKLDSIVCCFFSFSFYSFFFHILYIVYIVPPKRISLSLSLSLSHTHTHAHRQIHRHRHARAHTHTNTHTFVKRSVSWLAGILCSRLKHS